MDIQALNFALDIDGDGHIARWEVVHALKWGFTLPGRLLIEGLGNIPVVAQTLGIQASAATGYASFNSFLATVLNLLFWVGLLLFITRIGAHKAPRSSQAGPQEDATTAGHSRYRGPKVRRNDPPAS